MNPARTIGSAVVGGVWSALWVYFVAPPLGMFLAAECHLWRAGRASVRCAKLCHDGSARCIFCDYQHSRARRVGASSPGQFAATA
jgi:aquaporin Z